MRRDATQLSFLPKPKRFMNEANVLSEAEAEELLSPKKSRKRRNQHEKRFMNAVIDLAHSLGMPCIHVVYYCGNTFPVKCDHCGKYKMVTCTKRNNTHLTGQFDIIGIAWAIETKHKINKGKQDAKLSPKQEAVASLYRIHEIPSLAANESHSDIIIRFLQNVKSKTKSA